MAAKIIRNLARVRSLCSLKWISLFSGSSTATCATETSWRESLTRKSTARAAPNLPSLSLSTPKALEKSPSLSQMIGNLMPFKDKIVMSDAIIIEYGIVTLREADFMSIVLTVTWLSVQTPTT